MSSTRELYESYLEMQGLIEPKVIQEEVDLMEDVELLDDEELSDIVDDTIMSMAEEGYSLEDIETAFDDFISEATVTVGQGSRRGANGIMTSSGKNVTIGRGTEIRNAARRAAVVSKARERQVQAVKNAPGAAASRIKDAVKAGIGRVRRVVDNAAGDYAAKNKLVSSRRGTPLNRTSIGMKQASKDPSVRREIRSKVVGHLAQRAKDKIKSGLSRVRSAITGAGEKATSSVKSASDSIQTKVSSGRDSAKSKTKSGLGRLARGIANRAGKVASRFGEDVDVYDIVMDHLIEEEYASDEDSAHAIMLNMSEEWIDSIVEELLNERLTGRRVKRAITKFQDQNYRPDQYRKPSENKNPRPNYTLGAVARHKEGSPNPYNPATPEDYRDNGNRPTKRGGRGERGKAKTGYYGTDRRDSDRGSGNAARRRVSER